MKDAFWNESDLLFLNGSNFFIFPDIITTTSITATKDKGKIKDKGLRIKDNNQGLGHRKDKGLNLLIGN